MADIQHCVRAKDKIDTSDEIRVCGAKYDDIKACVGPEILSPVPGTTVYDGIGVTIRGGLPPYVIDFSHGTATKTSLTTYTLTLTDCGEAIAQGSIKVTDQNGASDQVAVNIPAGVWDYLRTDYFETVTWTGSTGCLGPCNTGPFTVADTDVIEDKVKKAPFFRCIDPTCNPVGGVLASAEGFDLDVATICAPQPSCPDRLLYIDHYDVYELNCP